MRPDAFKSTQRGAVRRDLEGYWAFHPHPLPREVNLDAETVLLLDEATAAVNRLGGLGLLLPNPHLLIAPYVRIEAVLSSRIEGTQTDIPELLRLEAGDRPPADRAADAREVANYVVALEHGIARVRDGFPISIRLIREMHERLLKEVRGRHRAPGDLRRSPVWIGGSTLANAVFVPPPPDAMRDALGDLEAFIHDRRMPLLVEVALVHYQFEVIHPFLDGNGRLGRILIPLMLVERGVLPEPLLYLSGYFEQHRDEYLDLLLRTSQAGDPLPWLKFFLEGVRQQARDAEQRTRRLLTLQADLRNQLLDERRPASVLRLVEALFSQPLVTARSAANLIEMSAPTAYEAIRQLVERGDLREISGRDRNRLYEATAIFEAAYAPINPLPNE